MSRLDDTLCAMYRSHAQVCETIRHHKVALEALWNVEQQQEITRVNPERHGAIQYFEKELATLISTEQQLRSMINDQEAW